MSKTIPQKKVFFVFPILIGLGIVFGFGVVQHDQTSVMGKDKLEAYHAEIRKIVASFPYVVGDYVGEDIAVPQGAIELLKPNAILSRRYTNIENGKTFDLLFVHCKDAQDMLGHHPPVCYPAVGWKVDRQHDLRRGEDLYATYQAVRQNAGIDIRLQIKQGLLLFGHNVTPDMNEALRMSSRRSTRELGAGQIQIVTTSEKTMFSVFEVLGKEIEKLQRSVSDASEKANR